MKPMDDLMLPEPYWLEPQTFGQIDYYTEAQMREYAKAAVEAYKAADSFCDANCTWADHHPDCFRARR